MDLPRIKTNRFQAIAALASLTLFIMSASLRAQSTPDLPNLFHYDGTTAITVSNMPSVSPTSQMTIMAWIKPQFDTQVRGSSQFVDTVIEKRDGCGSNRSYDFGVYQPPANAPAGTIFFSASVASDDLYSNVPIPNDGAFHHIAGVYDGSAMKIYLDGELVGQMAHSGLIPVTSDPPIIGFDRCGHGSFADMDHIKLFSRALSREEILSESSSGSGSSGTVTQVDTGAGLTGGPITTSGTISIAPAAVTNGMLENSSFNVNSGSGLTGGGSLALGGTRTLSLDTSVTDARYLRLTGGTLTGGLTTPTLATGTETIGGGDMITKHMSRTFGLTTPAMSPLTCAYSGVAFAGATDGDTIALGVSNSLMQAGSGIFNYTAWVFGPGTIQIRTCNLNPSGPKTSGVTGTIRVDVWKH